MIMINDVPRIELGKETTPESEKKYRNSKNLGTGIDVARS
jgi:hypothetical protein